MNGQRGAGGAGSAPCTDRAPGLGRRLGSMLYEFMLLFAVAFFGVWLFQFFAGTLHIDGWRRHLLMAFLLMLFGMYFVWNWTRGGQTLPMKSWRFKVVMREGHRPITALAAAVRYVAALFLVPSGLSLLSVAFDRDRQFLHDRLAGTLLVDA